MFGKNLQKLRLKRKLSHAELSEISGIDERRLQSIEEGRHQPSVTLVSKLRAALDCGWDELLKGLPTD